MNISSLITLAIPTLVRKQVHGNFHLKVLPIKLATAEIVCDTGKNETFCVKADFHSGSK